MSDIIKYGAHEDTQLIGLSTVEVGGLDNVTYNYTIQLSYTPWSPKKENWNTAGLYLKFGINDQTELLDCQFQPLSGSRFLSANNEFKMNSNMYLEKAELSLSQDKGFQTFYYSSGAFVNIIQDMPVFLKNGAPHAKVEINIPHENPDQGEYFMIEVEENRSFRVKGFKGEKFYDPKGRELTKAYPEGRPVGKKSKASPN